MADAWSQGRTARNTPRPVLTAFAAASLAAALFLGSTSATIAAALDGTLTVSSLPATSFAGEVVTLVAQTLTYPIGTPPPFGEVTFFDNGSAIGSHLFGAGVSLGNGQGFWAAAINSTFTTAGAHTITASWPGDSNFAAGRSNSYTLTVQSGTPSCPCVNNPTQTIVGIAQWDGGFPFGSSNTANIVVISGGFPFVGSPPGTATFAVDGQTVAMGSLMTPGPSESSSTFDIPQSGLGSHSVGANYSGYTTYPNYTFLPSSGSGTFTFIKGSTLITIHATTLTNSSAGNVALEADIQTFGLRNGQPMSYCSNTPVTGTVVFSDGTGQLASIPVSTTFAAGCLQIQSTTITLQAGHYSLVATYSGDTFFNGSSSSPQGIDVVGAPLTLQVPNAITVNATGPGGALVVYAATSSGGVGQVSIQCSPASGSLFAIGTTQVTCKATDQAGSQVQQSFDVTVIGAAGQAANLLNAVAAIGPGGSLTAKLSAVTASLAATPPDITSACGQLQAFVNEVQAQIGKSITSTEAAFLINQAQQIEAVLSC